MQTQCISRQKCMSSYDDHCGYSCTVYTKVDLKNIQNICSSYPYINYAVGIYVLGYKQQLQFLVKYLNDRYVNVFQRCAKSTNDCS